MSSAFVNLNKTRSHNSEASPFFTISQAGKAFRTLMQDAAEKRKVARIEPETCKKYATSITPQRQRCQIVKKFNALEIKTNYTSISVPTKCS